MNFFKCVKHYLVTKISNRIAHLKRVQRDHFQFGIFSVQKYEANEHSAYVNKV